MREMSALEAKSRFDHLLDQVEHGEEVVITRRGKPIAKLVPANLVSIVRKHVRPSPARRAKSLTLAGLKLKDLVAATRRISASSPG